MTVDADKLIAFAATLEGQLLKTRTRKAEFTVAVTRAGLEYTPVSTGKARNQYYKVIRRICDQFSATGSFASKDYMSFTVNSSYVLALIDKYVNRS